jgi:mannose-6-phosphate isomerase
MLRLHCEVKQYKWGQPGHASLVADLASCNSNAQVEPEAPYAELWMGAHGSGPSRLAKSGQTLDSWLAQNPLALGSEVLRNFGSELPFLFKVLSIQKALSIQSHPDKVLAKQLHATRPDVYKDAHHKPEIALAVGPPPPRRTTVAMLCTVSVFMSMHAQHNANTCNLCETADAGERL